MKPENDIIATPKEMIVIPFEEYKELLECRAIVENNICYISFLEETLRQTIHDAFFGKGGANNEN